MSAAAIHNFIKLMLLPSSGSGLQHTATISDQRPNDEVRNVVMIVPPNRAVRHDPYLFAFQPFFVVTVA